MRWLTVRPPGSEGQELVLMDSGNWYSFTEHKFLEGKP